MGDDLKTALKNDSASSHVSSTFERRNLVIAPEHPFDRFCCITDTCCRFLPCHTYTPAEESAARDARRALELELSVTRAFVSQRSYAGPWRVQGVWSAADHGSLAHICWVLRFPEGPSAKRIMAARRTLTSTSQMPKEAKKRLRAHRGEKEPAEDEDDEDDEEIDRLTAADAYMFPVLGSIVLFGLYLAFQYLSKEWINRVSQMAQPSPKQAR